MSHPLALVVWPAGNWLVPPVVVSPSVSGHPSHSSPDLTSKAAADAPSGASDPVVQWTKDRPEKVYYTREGQAIPVGYLEPMPGLLRFYKGIRLDTGAAFHGHALRLLDPPCAAAPTASTASTLQPSFA